MSLEKWCDMLTKIECARFRNGLVRFHPGLNVVMGDEAASNSIGKSTLLMLIDFAHGGMDFLKRSPEVADKLGDHDYLVAFSFGGETYVFRRRTSVPETVDIELLAGEPYSGSWTLEEYTSWLKDQYGVESDFLSFREAVSPFARIWKRDTLESDRPLQSYDGEALGKAVERILKLFGAYAPLHELETNLRALRENMSALHRAQKAELIPKITKRMFEENRKAIQEADESIQRLREDVTLVALNIRGVVNEAVLEARTEKDRLMELRLQLASRQRRINRDLAGAGAPRRQAFDALLQFFPDLNQDRLQAVQEFHSKLAKALRQELKEELKGLELQLKELDERIAVLDDEIANAIGSTDSPGYLVDRVMDVAADAHRRREANKFYQERRTLANQVKETQSVLKGRTELQLRSVESQINGDIGVRAASVFEAGRRSPHLTLEPSRYFYSVEYDTGTGTSYAAVALLDLAILELTQLPYLVHDSVMLKNIEVPVMEGLVAEYVSVGHPRQVFIAMDEVQKYGAETQAALRENASIYLSNSSLLYDLDWRQDDA